jgi:hypothetical protein
MISFTISFFQLPSPHTVSAVAGSSGVPGGRLMPREARKLLTQSKRGLPSTYRR